MCRPEIPALYRQPAILRLLPEQAVPICANRFHRHYSGREALLNRHYRATSTVFWSDLCHEHYMSGIGTCMAAPVLTTKVQSNAPIAGTSNSSTMHYQCYASWTENKMTEKVSHSLRLLYEYCQICSERRRSDPNNNVVDGSSDAATVDMVLVPTGRQEQA